MDVSNTLMQTWFKKIGPFLQDAHITSCPGSFKYLTTAEKHFIMSVNVCVFALCIHHKALYFKCNVVLNRSLLERAADIKMSPPPLRRRTRRCEEGQCQCGHLSQTFHQKVKRHQWRAPSKHGEPFEEAKKIREVFVLHHCTVWGSKTLWQEPKHSKLPWSGASFWQSRTHLHLVTHSEGCCVWK